LYFTKPDATIRVKNIVGGYDMSDRDGGGVLWFLAGLGVGAVVGILYAPRAGNETREALRSKAEEGREFVRERARQAREQASEWADRGREVVNQQKEQFRSAYEAGRQAYHETTANEGGPKNS
jgi:gas vesicle protein